MGAATIPAASGGKTRFALTLTSGTSWTVPAGVTYVNVTLQGGGSGSYGATSGNTIPGQPGSMISSTFAVTAGASITYAIGAGGAGGSNSVVPSVGGTTTFTGATSAPGGLVGGTTQAGAPGTPQGGFNNGASANASISNVSGGAGRIDVEYWV